jgi:hypothetical protein
MEAETSLVKNKKNVKSQLDFDFLRSAAACVKGEEEEEGGGGKAK